jgi:cilia- and flagella-associated protein 298
MMAYYYKKQEEQKKLEDDNEDVYLNSKWADPKALKNQLNGAAKMNIGWKPKN